LIWLILLNLQPDGSVTVFTPRLRKESVKSRITGLNDGRRVAARPKYGILVERKDKKEICV
jgi:hypothetical protein